jgi:hypothetical protein
LDASERIDLAAEWDEQSAPTTYLLDKNGRLCQINHGVARPKKLLKQLEKLNYENCK